MLRRLNARVLLALLMGVALATSPPGPLTRADAAVTDLRVNFQSQTAPVPPGYKRDFGEAYTDARGYGWIAQADATPRSIVGRGRDRDVNSNQLLDTFIHVNSPGTANDPARWECQLANGLYEVTVSVGDAAAVDSKHRVVVEGVTAINSFVPTSAQRFATATVRVSVTDGKLTLDAAGGSNTKLNYIEIGPANPPTAFRVNFQSQTAPVPAGYVADYGAAYDSVSGSGWIAQTDRTPKSIVGRGRDRNKISDQRLDTFIHMNSPGTAADPARWEHLVAAGDYQVTVAVGDAGAFDSVNTVNVEGVAAIPGFKPSATSPFATTTVRVTVSDGELTVDATRGTNTKLDYIEVEPLSSERRVQSSDPVDGASNVPVTTSVTLGLSHTIDNSQAVLKSLQVVDPSGTVLDGSYNGDAAGSLITFTPASALTPGAQYRVRTTSALVDTQGVAFTPYSGSFTTSTQGTPPTGVSFTRTTIDTIARPTVVTIGPDNNLYVATGSGVIRRYPLDSSGRPTGTWTAIDGFANQRTVLGLAFDPRSTAANPVLWVSNGALGTTDAPNFSGKISVLSGDNYATRRDVITGLPRATKDHMNNGISFGPDGKLYIAQGSLTGYGAPDADWGFREESPLSAAILVADVVNDSRFAGTVNVDTSLGYDPKAANAPVQVYVSGTRNPYDLVWHSNGSLYSAVNESAGGNAPAGPEGAPPAQSGLPAGRDYLARFTAGKYYGHPNPTRGQYVLNGGNPTAGVDPFETTQYPVGTQPDPSWQAPILDLGLHRSANGITEYRADSFGGALKNQLLFVEFSGGDDIVAVKLDAAGAYASQQQIAVGFNNPLDITSDPRTGAIYVAEYGTTTDGKITLLLPS